MSAPSYVIFTAAYNEERFIRQTIRSVIAQTVLPTKWVIVSDGSTDGTDDIVRDYSATHNFIKLLRQDTVERRGVLRKAKALALAYQELETVQYEFLGNLDADVSFNTRYFETLLERFQFDPALGISGGLIQEEQEGEFKDRKSNNVRSVAHAAQMVRRECYEGIGGYIPLKYGGEDWFAEVSARMQGWTVKAFADLKIMHHRRTGTADSAMRHAFRQGLMDYSVGSLPAFELLKCARRIPEWPVAIGAAARLTGFWWSYFSKQPRLVSPEFISFLRNEQRERLRLFFNGIPGLTRDLDNC
jgi:hypothetical protein